MYLCKWLAASSGTFHSSCREHSRDFTQLLQDSYAPRATHNLTVRRATTRARCENLRRIRIMRANLACRSLFARITNGDSPSGTRALREQQLPRLFVLGDVDLARLF